MNKDSDYVAEDEGSSSCKEGKTEKKPAKSKKTPTLLLNKKEMLETALKGFLPEGVTLTKMEPISKDQYSQMQAMKDAKDFSLNYRIFLGKVCKVTDGDTIKAIVFLNQMPTRFVFRLNGLDAPETRKGQVKNFGKKVKEIVTGMVEGKIVRIEAGDFDKYGRILARVYPFAEGKEFCLNEFLIEQDMAKQYYGKSKVEFTSEDEEEFMVKLKQKRWPKVEDYPLELL